MLTRANGRLVQANCIALRQSYDLVGISTEVQAGSYAHAEQFRRMRGQVKKPCAAGARHPRSAEEERPDEPSFASQVGHRPSSARPAT